MALDVMHNRYKLLSILGNGHAALHDAALRDLAEEIGAVLVKAEALFGLAAALP